MNVTFVTFNITGRQTTMIPKFLQNVKYLYIAFIKHLWMRQLEIEKYVEESRGDTFVRTNISINKFINIYHTLNHTLNSFFF